MLLVNETFEKFKYLPETLTTGSKKKVLVKCDFCESIVEKPYQVYLLSKKSNSLKDSCKTCKSKKQAESIKNTKGKAESIQQKRSDTNIQKYGHVSPANNTDIQKKIQQSNLQKYGSIYTVTSPEIIEKIKKTNIQKYGVDNIFKNPEKAKEIRDKKSNKTKKFLQNSSLSPKAIEDYSTELNEYLTSLGVTCISINTLETISIAILSKKIEIFFTKLISNEKKELLIKLNQLEKLDTRLIVIFEDEWLCKKEIVKSRLSHILQNPQQSIHARKCEVRKGNFKKFIDLHHIQGNAGSAIQYGLFYDNELVAVMTFGHPRFSNKYEWELIRFVSSKHVNGGASKLFTSFVKEYNPKSIVSYCDLRWGTGKLYEKLGFDLLHQSEPSYHYVKDQRRFNRMTFRKSELVKQGFDSNMSESEIMDSLGYAKIYDCGNKVFVWKQPQTL